LIECQIINYKPDKCKSKKRLIPSGDINNNKVIKAKTILLAVILGMSLVFLTQMIGVLAQQLTINNQSSNKTTSNATTNQSNTFVNNTTNTTKSAFDSLKDTFGSLFGK